MKSWADIYRERMNDLYRAHVRTKYAKFIETILLQQSTQWCSPCFLELGCGAGNITRALAEHEPQANFTMIDIDPEMLALADQNTEHIRNRSLHLGDIRDSRGDFNIIGMPIVHSHGVLEHHSNDGIIDIINSYKNVGPQVHYVPTSKYVTPSRGDERLLTPAMWDMICHPDEMIEFNDGLDLILVFKERLCLY